MEDVLSHPVLTEFISHYPSHQHQQCVQALALLGLTCLHGKPVSAPRLFARASTATESQKRSLSRKRPLKSPQSKLSNRQSRGASTARVHSERALRLSPNKPDNWNLFLYGRRSQGSIGTRQKKLQKETQQKSGRASARIATPVSSTPVKARLTPGKEALQRALVNTYLTKA